MLSHHNHWGLEPTKLDHTLSKALLKEGISKTNVEFPKGVMIWKLSDTVAHGNEVVVRKTRRRNSGGGREIGKRQIHVKPVKPRESHLIVHNLTPGKLMGVCILDLPDVLKISLLRYQTTVWPVWGDHIDDRPGDCTFPMS